MIYRYILVFISAAIEGPLVAIFVGFLISLGQLSLLPTYIILLFGDIIPDTFYYYVGLLGNRWSVAERYGKYLNISDAHLKTLSHLMHNHGGKTMALGKLAYGLSTPILISAGLVKLPLKRFLSYVIPVTIVQYAVFLTLGYYFGSSYVALKHYFAYAEFVIAGAALILLFAIFRLRKVITGYTENNLLRD